MVSMKAIVPLLIVAIGVCLLVPMFLIWGTSQYQNSAVVTGNETGAYNIFINGSVMTSTIMADMSNPLAIMIIIAVLVMCAMGIVALIMRSRS